MSAPTVNPKFTRYLRANWQQITADIVGPTSYTNPGGDAVAAADIKRLFPYWQSFNAGGLEYLVSPRTDGFTLAIDLTTGKCVIRDNTGAEVANLSNQSTRTWRVSFIYFDNGPFINT